MIGSSPPGASKAAPKAAVSNKGQINQPGDAAWNRMKYEENQSTQGIHTGEALKQRDFDRVKQQRMAEASTPEDRRADAAAARGAAEIGSGGGNIASAAKRRPGTWVNKEGDETE